MTGAASGAASGHRRRLLAFLYGADRALVVAAQLEALLARAPRPRAPPLSHPVPVLDEHAAWIVAYPDHVTAPGRTPLAALDELIETCLAPVITGVHTLPVHPSTSDRGFSVVDHSSIDPRLGDWDDIERLAAHGTWMADAVVNHVSAQGVWFHRFLSGEAPYDEFFVRFGGDWDASAVVRPRTTPLAHEFTAADGRTERVWTTFSADQVDLHFANPAVLLAIVEVLLRYARHGARAIRLDAIAFAWKDPATTSVHLPQTHAIVQLFRACLDEVAPELVLVTETNVPHAENISYFGVDVRAADERAAGVREAGVGAAGARKAGVREADAVYQFALPPLVLHAVLGGSTVALRAWLAAAHAPPPGRTFLNFLASHDGVGVRPAEGLLDAAGLDLLVRATATAGGIVNMRTADGTDRPYELAVAWFALMAHGVTEDVAVRRHLASHAVALALQGVPLLYLNSLFGVGNDIETHARTGHARDLNRGGTTLADIAAHLTDPTSRAARIWAGLRTMLATRASSPAFHPAAGQFVHDSPDGTLVVERTATTGQRALVAVNLTASEHDVAPTSGWPPIRLAPWASSWVVR